MPLQPTYTIFPLGDSALLLDFGNTIYPEVNRQVLYLYHALRKRGYPFVRDLVPAYSSLAVYYDPWELSHFQRDEETLFDVLAEMIESLPLVDAPEPPQRDVIRVPVCYEPSLAPDLQELAKAKGLSTDEVIRIHTTGLYTVYMNGFVPGFAYMGEVEESIAMDRKATPVPVAAGSVGIAGKQTGVYPLPSPGGWQVIGRTPLQLFDPQAQEPVLLQPGDRIQFYPITHHEFENYQSRTA